MAVLILAVSGAVLFAHWPALSAKALSFDDSQYLTENPLVQNPSWASAGRFLREVLAPSTVGGYYQPLAMISLMLDYRMGGRSDNLTPFHRTSLALHVANTALIIVFLYLLFRNPWAAAMAGLLFGVHPMTVEPIPWIGDRKTVLATFFALWSLVAYTRYAQTKRSAWFGSAIIFFVLALMSKPTTTPLPLLLLLLDYWPLRRLSRRAVVEKAPFFVIACVSAAITYVSQRTTAGVYDPGELSRLRVPLILCHNIMFYPWKMLWPVNLSSHYPFPEPMSLSHPMVLAGVIGTPILIAVVLASLRWTRALLTGWLFFFLAILPAMGIVGFTRVIAADKFAYLPAVGLLLALTSLLARLWSGSPARRAAALSRWGTLAIVLLLCGLETAATRRYLVYWQDSETLFLHILALAPNDGDSHSNLANALAMRGNIDEAVEQYTTALRLDPSLSLAYYGLAGIAAEKGDYASAINLYTKAVEHAPKDYLALNNRGNTYFLVGDYERAARDYSSALEIRPDYAEAYHNRGLAYASMGDDGRAIADFSKAAELRPDYADAYNSRGNAFNRRGDHESALLDFTKAIALRPDYAQAYNNRGNTHAMRGAYNLAISDFTRAIELAPGYAQTYCNRGTAFAALGKHDEAVKDTTRAIQLAPEYPEAYDVRANAYYHLNEYEKAWADVKTLRRLGRTPSAELLRGLVEATGRSE